MRDPQIASAVEAAEAGYDRPMDRHFRHPSRPARWSGAELVPAQSARSDETEVWAGCVDDDTTIWEAFIATPIDDEDTVRLDSVPAYAYGLNYGDTVEYVASAEGPLVISRLARSGGQATFRIWLGSYVDPSRWRAIAESYARRGCIVDVVTTSLIALSCAAADADAIRRLLDNDSTSANFIWESGA